MCEKNKINKKYVTRVIQNLRYNFSVSNYYLILLKSGKFIFVVSKSKS